MKYLILLFIVIFIQCTGKGSKTSEAKSTFENNVKDASIEGSYPYKIEQGKNYPAKHLILQDVADIEYVRLETNDSCLIGNVHLWGDILCDSNDIFIAANKIFRFNRKGQFLNEIGKEGEGPGEYNNYGNISIDKYKKIILLNELSRHVLSYNYDGEFSNSVYLEGSDVYPFCMIAPDTLACFSRNTTVASYTLRSSKDGSILREFSQPYMDFIKNVSVYYSPALLTKYYSGNAFFSFNVTDTIFSIDRDGRWARYILLPPNRERKETESATFLVLNFESSRFSHMDLTAVHKHRRTEFLAPIWVDKKTNEIYEGYVIDYNISGPVQWIRQTGQDDEIAALYLMEYLKKRLEENRLTGELKGIVESSKEDDNPILMIAKFKK